MHYIAEKLDTEAWVKAGLGRLERYLTCWRRFTELYPETQSPSESVQIRARNA